MLKSIQWDIYTMIMVALVPTILLLAWGLNAWDTHRLHNLQCEIATEWLEESTLLAPQFTQAGSMSGTQFWITSFEELNAPSDAGQLRWGILQSANYNLKYAPNRPTDEPGMLNPQNGLFSRDIEDGIDRLISHCPDAEAMLPDAFPMIFREENTP